MAERICEHCGAKCGVGDEYCQSCWKKLPEETRDTGVLLHGIDKLKWKGFLDLRAQRYMDVYEKNEDKKFFLHLNWSALFFGTSWMLYRKMYKFAIIIMLITTLLSFAVMGTMVMVYKDDVDNHILTLEKYDAYLDDGGENYIENPDGSSYMSEELAAARDATDSLYAIMWKMILGECVLALAVMLTLGLTGDWIYRCYILKNIGDKTGGTSFMGMIGMQILLNVVSEILLSPILTFLYKIIAS